MWTRALGVLFAVGLGSGTAGAELLRIIHTNDLHSHLDHANDPTRGSYPAVKATIDALKLESAKQSIETLTLDAGDFNEDSQYYLADRGYYAWRAMDAMGYDAVVLGNHDWLAGVPWLDEVVGRIKPSFTLLGANFLFGWSNKNLVKHMRQWLEVRRAGARIGILGLTTDDYEFSWMAKPGLVYKPVWEARDDLPGLRSRNDFVIALTHLGVRADKALIRQTSGIDLVVGGHSHTRLDEPEYEVDASGRTIAIVQTGMHGNFVGDLLIDVQPGRPLQILSYRLVPVFSGGPRDERMELVERQARAALDRDYGAEWLREIVGYTEVPLENEYLKGEPTHWSRFIGEAIRQSARADLAIDVTEFHGFDQPIGPISREQLFILYPRIFEFGEFEPTAAPKRSLGYTIWTSYIRGWILELAFKQVAGSMPINPAGITYKTGSGGEITDIRVGGHPIEGMRNYKVAFPEAIMRGAFGLSEKLKIVFKDARDTGIPVWQASENELKRIGGVIRAPNDGVNP